MKYATLTVEFRVAVEDDVDVKELYIDVDQDTCKVIKLGTSPNSPAPGYVIGYATVDTDPLDNEN